MSAVSTTTAIEHDDRVVDASRTGRPGHLAQLGPDLADELARLVRFSGGLGRGAAAGGGVRGRRAVLGQLTLALQHALRLSVHRHGG